MYRKLALLFCVSAVSIAVSAQQSIQGKVLDKDNEGIIELASVRLLKKADSTLVKGTQTDSRGSFTLNKVNDGNYLVEIRYLGYENNFTPVTVAGKNVIMKNIFMSPKSKELSEVTVTGMAAQVSVRGDTIEYNPAAFKLAENAVVEDLLKKLPGVTVDNDGKITVNGEEIKRIRVDGKKFFDGDMQMTTKNMPADMVDKVQVIDLKSEQAQMSGFEDENTERIINLTIKENRRKGTFGNATLGGGFDRDSVGRYDANAFVNIWQGDVRTTVTGGANNTNSMRSGRGRGGMSGGGGGGYTETQNIGVNVNAELGKKTVIGGDASFNQSSNESTTKSERYNYTNTKNTKTIGDNSSTRTNQEASMSGELEWVPDTVNTFIFQPRVNMGWSNSRSGGTSEYFDILTDSANVESYKKTSQNITSNESNGQDNSANLTFMYNRKSPNKKGRTITLNMSGSLSSSDTKGKNKNEKTTYRSTGNTITGIDQHNTNESNSFSTNIRFSYVEPIKNLKNFVELGASFSANSSKSEKMQYNMAADSTYTLLDSAYSNRYNNLSMNQSIDLTFQHRETNYNYNIGISAQPFQNSSENDYFIGTDRKISQSGINFSPTARLQYNLMPATGTTSGITGGRNRSFIRLDYRGRMQQPGVQQMQPVKNNDNLMRETVGNPGLVPSFNQNFQLQYSNNNSQRLSSFSLGLSGSFTQNALVSNQIIDESNKTWSQTVNAKDIPFNASSTISFNTPIIKNRLQFSTNTSGNFSQSFSYSKHITGSAFENSDNEMLIIGDLGITNRWGGNENINITFTTDWLEIGARGQVQYTGSRNSLNNNKLTETFNWTGSGNVNLNLPYNLIISNDLGYTARSGYSSLTKNELIWNASIQKSVLNSLGTITLSLYDILRQRQNISENISDNSRSLSQYNSLTSYFMLSFTYRISQFGGGGGGFGGFGGSRGGFGGGGMGGGRF